MVGVPAWVRWLMCQRGWRTKVNSVGDIEGNVGSELDSVVVAHYFSNSFQKLARNEYCSKLEKELRFQVRYTSNISYFLEFPLDISV